MTCAILANLLQQWVQKYLKVTQPRSTTSEPRVFEALPAVLHLSVFLFFAGPVVFLWNFDPTISKLILSPYDAPLSSLAWSIVTGVPYISLQVFELVFYFFKYFLVHFYSNLFVFRVPFLSIHSLSGMLLWCREC
ncbi:hypothetical protein V8E53_013741 [Lactarius tabidus]